MEARADERFYRLNIGRHFQTGVEEIPAAPDIYTSLSCDFIITKNLYVLLYSRKYNVLLYSLK